MSEIFGNALPSWREAAEVNGFGILCIRSEKGESFTVSAVNGTKAAILADVGLLGAMVSEAELLEKLAQVAMSEADVHKWLLLSRAWSTTFTHSKARG